MFEQIIEEHNIKVALEHLVNGKDTCGIDGMYIHELPEYLEYNKAQLIRHLSTGRWYPGLVKLTEIVNRKGKVRKISSINSIDKLVSRCVFQVLEPEMDKIFSQYSYAYRKTKGVDAAVIQAREYATDMKPYVVAIDFENFFDSIDHMILIGRLHQFLHEPRMEELILKFIQSEALVDGQVIKINKGILQGSALSPLLSNFYLCGFDHYLE